MSLVISLLPLAISIFLFVLMVFWLTKLISPRSEMILPPDKTADHNDTPNTSNLDPEPIASEKAEK